MGFTFGKKKDKARDESPGPAPYLPDPVAKKDPYAIDNNKYAYYGGKPTAYEKAKQMYAPPGSAAAAQRQQAYGGPSSSAASARAPSYAPPSMNGSPPPAYAANQDNNPGSTYGGAQQPSVDAYGGRPQGGSSRGAGGYGGLGRVNSNDTLSTQAGKDALFGGAKDRAAKKEQKNSFFGDNKQASGEYPAAGTPSAGSSARTGYGAYQDRNLTAEEEEDEDVQATKVQMKEIKKQDINSTRNALALAYKAEQSGLATLARLGGQGERIHNTERTLDLSMGHTQEAKEKAKELANLNKGMFVPKNGLRNPFTSKQRTEERNAAQLAKHHAARTQREDTAREALIHNQRLEKNFKELGQVAPNDPNFAGYRSANPTKASLAERAKYQFEADSEDDDMENEVDSGLEQIGGAAKRLNKLAQAMGEEVEDQNRHLERISRKTDKVDDAIVLNQARLDRIR